MKPNITNSPAGFSLVDIVIVITIIGILVTLALPQFKRATSYFTRQNAAEELKVYLDRARFDSVKRSAKTSDQMATVVLNNSQSFTLKSDFNSDGEVQSSEVRTTNLSTKNNIKISGNNLIYPITISYNYLGQVNAVNGNNVRIDPVFVISEQGKSTNEYSTTLLISKAGNVSLQNGIYETLDITNPKISKITADQKVKKSMIVSN